MNNVVSRLPGIHVPKKDPVAMQIFNRALCCFVNVFLAGIWKLGPTSCEIVSIEDMPWGSIVILRMFEVPEMMHLYLSSMSYVFHALYQTDRILTGADPEHSAVVIGCFHILEDFFGGPEDIIEPFEHVKTSMACGDAVCDTIHFI